MLRYSGRLEEEAILKHAWTLSILLLTQVTGQHYMRQKLHDAIKNSYKGGHLDFFVTMSVIQSRHRIEEGCGQYN